MPDGPAPTTMRHRVGEAVNGHLRLWSMMVLTMVTGMLDAVGYLGLDRVFTANMTGNVVILGMALMGGDNLPVLGPVVALAGFMAGALVSGRTLRLTTSGWSRRTSALLVGVGLAGMLAAITARSRRPRTGCRRARLAIVEPTSPPVAITSPAETSAFAAW